MKNSYTQKINNWTTIRTYNFTIIYLFSYIQIAR